MDCGRFVFGLWGCSGRLFRVFCQGGGNDPWRKRRYKIYQPNKWVFGVGF